MNHLSIAVHEIAVDGLPPRNAQLRLTGFLFRGNVLRGHPLYREDYPALYTGHVDGTLWEATNLDGPHRIFSGVTHWAELPPTLATRLTRPQPLLPLGVPAPRQAPATQPTH